jgi:hypothetical protein
MGEWENSGDSSTYFTNHSQVKNCDFNNVSYLIVYNGNYNEISGNTMRNLSNAVVGGIGSYGANGITMTGSYNTIINNTIKGAWAYSSYFGLNGGAVELFNVNNYNFIAYNTFSDCGGIGEFGAGKAYQVAKYNTFAYNKIINCGDVSYANISGAFAIEAKNIRWWNNVIIENRNSRFSGVNFGTGFTSFGTWPTSPTAATKFFSNNGSPLADTVWDLRNNIFWIVNKTGSSTYIVNNGVKTVHINNIYKLTNGATPGYSLTGSELSTSSKIFTDTSNIDPMLWDLTPGPASFAIDAGVNVNLTKDFAGVALTNPPCIGLYQASAPPPVSCSSFTYSGWTTCANGTQTRTYTKYPTDCTDTPPADSLSRSCVVPVTPCTFTYSAWGTCASGTQTRTYTSSPSGCNTTPPVDSLLRACTPTSTLTIVVTYIKLASYLNRYDGAITVAASSGVTPYYYSINSTTAYTLNKTSFTNLKAGTYVIRVKDCNNNISAVTAVVGARRNRTTY